VIATVSRKWMVCLFTRTTIILQLAESEFFRKIWKAHCEDCF
jgi:hypothetical protein